MLTWIFGKMTDLQLTHSQPDKVSGYLELKRARVNWKLSLDINDVPEKKFDKKANVHSDQSKQKEKEIEFSDGFTDLHTVTYQKILNGEGFGLEDARPSIEVVHKIRSFKL